MFRSVTIAAATTAALIAAPTTLSYAAVADGNAAGSDISSSTHAASAVHPIVSFLEKLNIDAEAALAEAAEAVTGTALKAEPRKYRMTGYQIKRRAARLDYRVTYKKAKKRLGASAVGRRLDVHGVVDGGKTRKATVAELRASDARLEAWLAPAQTGGAAAPAQAGGSGAAPNAHLQSIAQCESGGDPGAVSPDGTYRGKYQFDQQTWESVGGSGDPAAAPESVQDQLAAKLYAQRGSSPWGCA